MCSSLLDTWNFEGMVRKSLFLNIPELPQCKSRVWTQRLVAEKRSSIHTTWTTVGTDGIFYSVTIMKAGGADNKDAAAVYSELLPGEDRKRQWEVPIMKLPVDMLPDAMVVCRDFRRGYCRREKNCKYSHSPNPRYRY